nr:PREDICTED: pyrroline-5-carboxylate reductase 3 [Apteryx mantelli mantelli]
MGAPALSRGAALSWGSPAAIHSGLCIFEGKVPAGNILASAPSDRNLGAFRESGCRTTHCNLEVLQDSTLVFLATKPHVLPGVLQEIRPAVCPHHIIVSLAAGVTLQTLQRLLPAGTKVLRLMPNLPCVVQAGAMVFSRGDGAGEQEAALLKSLLSSCGLCEEVPESYINIHTGLSGSGVAYGAAKMMLETGEHPAKLRGDVCTPGGTTIHALHQLEKGALRATVMNAVEAATNRACDMGTAPNKHHGQHDRGLQAWLFREHLHGEVTAAAFGPPRNPGPAGTEPKLRWRHPLAGAALRLSRFPRSLYGAPRGGQRPSPGSARSRGP